MKKQPEDKQTGVNEQGHFHDKEGAANAGGGFGGTTEESKQGSGDNKESE